MVVSISLKYITWLLCVQVLLEHGADVHASDDNGSTALIRAAAGGHLEIVQVILFFQVYSGTEQVLYFDNTT